MIVEIIAIIGLVSILLAIWSFQKQTKLGEVKTVQEELKQGKVIYDSSSSKPSARP